MPISPLRSRSYHSKFAYQVIQDFKKAHWDAYKLAVEVFPDIERVLIESFMKDQLRWNNLKYWIKRLSMKPDYDRLHDLYIEAKENEAVTKPFQKVFGGCEVLEDKQHLTDVKYPAKNKLKFAEELEKGIDKTK